VAERWGAGLRCAKSPVCAGALAARRLSGAASRARDRKTVPGPAQARSGDCRTATAIAPRPDQTSFLAFGAAPRFCRNLGFLESKSAMAMPARNLRIELDDSNAAVTDGLRSS
jgi:hypothetical protein